MTTRLFPSRSNFRVHFLSTEAFHFGDEFDGDYIEVGYGFDWQGVDLSIAYITSDDLGVSQAGLPADQSLVFGISRSFAIGD